MDKLGIKFDMYEIDESIQLLDESLRNDVVYGDFFAQTITKKYKTIIGNPPYVRTKTGNLYIDFISKCINLLNDGGELIFIVPSDFLKLTCAARLINKMFEKGNITYIFHPNDEHLFENASIDVIIFRYCHLYTETKQCLYNDEPKYIHVNNGIITFADTDKCQSCVNEHFNVYVGMVSGKESVYKNAEYGTIDVLIGKNKINKYIYINEYPTDSAELNEYMEENKETLISRRIRKFNESNWFEWGAPRNLATINRHFGKPCIYVYNLSRKDKIAFLGKVQYFGGNLIMLIPKKKCKLIPIIDYLNSETFKKNYMYSGRFKIGHKQLANASML